MSKPGNTNASKPGDEKLTSFLYIRAHPEHKKAWTIAARKRGEKLSKWVTDILNNAARQD